MIVFEAFVNNVNTCNNLKSIQIDLKNFFLKTFSLMKYCFGNYGENVGNFKAIKSFCIRTINNTRNVIFIVARMISVL